MKIKSKLPIIVIVLLGFILRFYDYAEFPVYGESQDEMAWTWMGTSILTGNHPTSWSGTGASGYWQDETLFFGGAVYRIVSPYLDNPHLFSLIPGSIALLRGYSEPRPVPITIVRFPMLLLASINIYLLYLATKKWINYKSAVFASALYATIPSIVFANRLIVAENLLIAWMLISWILLHKLIVGKQKKWVIPLAIVSGLSGLTKIAGLVILAANTLILINSKLFKHAKKVFFIGLAIFSIYPIYGLIVNKELFLDVIFRQSQFSIGLSGLINLFVHPLLVRKIFIDGWLYFGLISLIFILFKSKKDQFIHNIFNIYTFLWLGFILVATTEVAGNGWYRYPLFPLMAIAMSQIILLSKTYINSLVSLYLFVWLPTLRLIFISKQIAFNLRYLILLGFVPLIFKALKVNKSTQKNLYIGFIYILLITNILVSLFYTKQAYWDDSVYYYPVRSVE